MSRPCYTKSKLTPDQITRALSAYSNTPRNERRAVIEAMAKEYGINYGTLRDFCWRHTERDLQSDTVSKHAAKVMHMKELTPCQPPAPTKPMLFSRIKAGLPRMDAQPIGRIMDDGESFPVQMWTVLS